MKGTPDIRIQVLNKFPVRADGEFVLYWMIAYRRNNWNFSLQRAVEWAYELNKPLVILEALRCGYRWASDRLHSFILEGMADNAQRLAATNVFYYPYIETQHGEGKGLLAALGGGACVVVTDEFPAFFFPRMVAAAARQIAVRFEQVDSNGLLPLRVAQKVFLTAQSFRRSLQKNIIPHLQALHEPDPIAKAHLPKLRALPEEITAHWPLATPSILKGDLPVLKVLPIDHSVAKITAKKGGFTVAQKILEQFLKNRLARYNEKRNEPEEEVTSGLSPYLHFGHISSHHIFYELTRQEGWSVNRLRSKTQGERKGWWGMSEASKAFLDQLITWRELGFNMCWQRQDYDQYESLPEWAKDTLSAHAGDLKPYTYTLEQLEMAKTRDPIWNAAQLQLVVEGGIHNYLRMLWGKKILEWSQNPQEALEIMIQLNNKYALDGRDPNSYSGIFWVLGRYDRPWGPERPIFGKIRYMSSENTARKVRVKNYIKNYAP